MPDMSFEQKFAQLVDAQLNERLPSMIDNRVGFQLIDKNEDETQAVGVAAFVLNGIWLYVPIFFLKGDLKGFELMYVKQRDVFVPAMDNWISALSQQGLSVLGKGRMDDSKATLFNAPENTQIYSNYADIAKYAARFDANSVVEKSDWVGMSNPPDPAKNEFGNLLGTIPILGKQACHTFLTTFMKSPDFANAMFRFYTPDAVEKLAKECLEVIEKAPPSQEKEAVLFVTDINSKEASDLAYHEKQQLIRNGLYVRDQRTSLSKVFHEEIDSTVVQNPTGPGIYDVLLLDGSYRTYIVLFPQDIAEAPNYPCRRNTQNVGRSVALIDIEAPGFYVKKRSTEVFCKPAVGITEEHVKAMQGGGKASLRNLRDMKRHIGLLFAQTPTRVIETRLVNRQKSPDGNIYVTVMNSAANMGDSEYGPRQEIPIEFVPELARLQVTTGHLCVPENTRVFVESDFGDSMRPVADNGNQYTPKNVTLGNYATVMQLMQKRAGLQHISVYADAGTAQIMTGNHDSGLLRKEAALRHLICDLGIYAGQARVMLKQASGAPGHKKGYLIKYAAPFDLVAYGDSKRPWMGGPAPIEHQALRYENRVIGGNPLTGATASDNSPMMPQQAIQRAMEAAQAGIKEVFDVNVLSGLIDKADISELRKDYLADITRGMDRVGRMLFLFYWHNDEFEDRYGKEDMDQLEDTLQNVFLSTGDLVLFLKEKTAYGPDAVESLFGHLSEDIGTSEQ